MTTGCPVGYLSQKPPRWAGFLLSFRAGVKLQQEPLYYFDVEKQRFWTIFLSAPIAPVLKNEDVIFIVVSPSLTRGSLSKGGSNISLDNSCSCLPRWPIILL